MASKNLLLNTAVLLLIALHSLIEQSTKKEDSKMSRVRCIRGVDAFVMHKVIKNWVHRSACAS